MLRTFIALDLGEPFVRAVVAWIDALRTEPLPHPRWVPSATLHVTLRFLGNVDETRLPELAGVVTQLGASATGAVTVAETRLLAFPAPGKAHVLGLALDDAGAIVELAATAEHSVRALGFPPEERAFVPHLTLARFRKAADLRSLFDRQPGPLAGVAGRLEAVTLYASELGEGGPVHTALARRLLGTPAG